MGMAALIIVMSASAPICLAGAGGEENPGIIPIDASYAGQTYAEWMATEWQWLLGVPCPENSNPCLNGSDTGSISDMQPQQLWFLPTVLLMGQKQTLQFTIPAGKALFYMLFATEWDNFLCVSPPTSYSPEQLRQIAIDLGIKAIDTLEVDVDGVPVKDPKQYAVVTHSLDIILPPDNLLDKCWGCNTAPGIYGPGFAAGYAILFKPLPVGKHVIHESVSSTSVGVPLTDLTYDITVVP